MELTQTTYALTLTEKELRIVLDSMCKDWVDRPKYAALNTLIDQFREVLTGNQD